jgi:hypothetical protein
MMPEPKKMTQAQELSYLHSLFTNPKSKFYDPAQKKRDLTGINAQKERVAKRVAAYRRLLRWRRRHTAKYRRYQRDLMRRRKKLVGTH